jgi:hypothetical protein
MWYLENKEKVVQSQRDTTLKMSADSRTKIYPGKSSQSFS